MKYELLKNIEDIKIEKGVDLTKYSTMRLRAIGDLITVTSVNSLASVLKILTSNKIKYRILGLGANQLLPQKSNRPYLKLAFDFDEKQLDAKKASFIVPASLPLTVLTSFAIKYGLKGYEVFTGIPATIGGAVYMNAGTSLGEIGQLVKSVKVMDGQGNIREVEISEGAFSYRKNHFVGEGEVIIEVELYNHGHGEEISRVIKDYLAYRNKSQPLQKRTCGCVFKNPVLFQAGKLIDLVGLKGLSVGDLKISHRHANFIENRGKGTLEDFLQLVDIITSEVKLQFEITLEREVFVPDE